MNNPLKKYAVLSIIINLLLILIYGGCFAKKQSLDITYIEKSLTRYNNNIEHYNDDILVYATLNLPWRHIKNTEILDGINMNDAFVGSFSCEADSLIKSSKIHQKIIDKIFHEYDNTIDSLYKEYCHNLDSLQKEGKLMNSEIKEWKENIYQIAFEDYKITKEDIQDIPSEQQKLLLSSMKAHLQAIQTHANWDFLSFFGHRAMIIYKYYPFFMKDYSTIKKGKETDMIMFFGNRIGGWYERREYYSVFINGNKIDISNNKAILTIEPTLNEKETEAIVVWRDTSPKKYDIDTAYFNYKITP